MLSDPNLAGMTFYHSAHSTAARDGFTPKAQTRDLGSASKRAINARPRIINQRRWWIPIAACVLIATATDAALSGDHVCQHQERYTINVTEYYPRNITIRSFQWCLQVPPRCSSFSYRIINESRIIEETQIRQVNVCCNGYEPDIYGKRCLSACNSRCVNGKCNEENKCYCSPGFRGEYCDSVCDSNRWGRYCRYQCECQRGSCNVEYGQCQCPPGWTGPRCERPCPLDKFGVNCTNLCDCRADQICEPQDGRCTNKVKLAVLKKYHTFDSSNATVFSPSQKVHNVKKIDMYLLTTEPSSVQTSLTPISLTPSKPTAKISSINNVVSISPPVLIAPLTSVTKQVEQNTSNLANYADSVTAAEINAESVTNAHNVGVEVNIKSMDRKVMKSEIRAKGKVWTEVVGNEGTTEELLVHLGTNKESNSLLFNFLLVGFLSVIVVAGSGFFIATRLLKREEKEKLRITAIAQLKPRSIFHTPLPEPPQSPFFESPPCSLYHQRIEDNNATINPWLLYTSTTTSPHILEYISERSEVEEVPDVFYDQLPSTRGTYKTTTALEPPMPLLLPLTESAPFEVRSLDNCLPTGNQVNKKRIVEDGAPLPLAPLNQVSEVEYQSEIAENLYDEIPCWTRTTDNDTLYINTRVENKTKF